MYLNAEKPIGTRYDPAKGLPQVEDRRVQRLRCYLTLALADTVALVVSFVLANTIYLQEPAASHGFTLLSVMLPIFFCFAAVNSSYGGESLLRQEKSFTRSMQAVLFAGTAVALIIFLMKAGNEVSRAVFAIGWATALIGLPGLRLAIAQPLLRRMGGTPFSKVVIVDGMEYEPAPGEIVIPVDGIGFDPASNDPHGFHAFAGTVAHADRIVVACPPERYSQWSIVLKGIAVSGEILSISDDGLGIIGVGRHHNLPTMIVSQGPLTLRDRLTKRVFDLSVAIFGLIVTSPILLIAAIAIRLESRGPILFMQKRIGQDNKIFEMCKFRSMYTDRCDADAAQLTTKNDPRVTHVGDFIRKTSIDELPQLINVLRGDMSIVGPRPHAMSAKAADQLYWDVDTRYRHRHSMKPGLTGLAQVRGFRGPTDRTVDLTNRLGSDLEYVDRWSIWLDFYLVMRTAGALFGRNAF